MTKFEFFNQRRLFESTPDEIEKDWLIYQKTMYSKYQDRKKIVTFSDFANTNRLFECTHQEISNDWNVLNNQKKLKSEIARIKRQKKKNEKSEKVIWNFETIKINEKDFNNEKN
jgi:hypothetical protein